MHRVDSSTGGESLENANAGELAGVESVNAFLASTK